MAESNLALFESYNKRNHVCHWLEFVRGMGLIWISSSSIRITGAGSLMADREYAVSSKGGIIFHCLLGSRLNPSCDAAPRFEAFAGRGKLNRLALQKPASAPTIDTFAEPIPLLEPLGEQRTVHTLPPLYFDFPEA